VAVSVVTHATDGRTAVHTKHLLIIAVGPTNHIVALPGPDLSRAGLGTDNSGAVARRKPIGDSKSRQLLRQSIVTADGMSMSKRRQKGTHAQRIRWKGSALCPYPFPYYPYYPLPIPSPNRGLTHRMLLTPAIGT